uniref:TNFR-Cys domain-containing protein n=1 Tax=Esox lucius TaxID=8010 RepID=A0AAY5KLQ5_ESOLU
MRNHLCCSALVLLTVFGTGGTVAVQCRWGEGCECLKCPSGQEPTKACGQVESPGEAVQCQSCPVGTFSDTFDSDQCRPHSDCGVFNRKVVAPGTSFLDAVCGDCMSGFQPVARSKASTLTCVRAPAASSARVREVRTVGKVAAGGTGLPVNGTAVRSPEEKSTEYAVFALVPIFCVMGLLGILICNILKKKGYRCTAEKEGGDEEYPAQQKEGNGGAYAVNDPNEDTISVLVRLITEKKENASALEELLLEYESNQLAVSKATSIKFPVLSPLTQFRSLPKPCPHQSHLHTVSGLSGLYNFRRGYSCSRCAQRKWPPVLMPPVEPLRPLKPLKPPQSLLLPLLDLPKSPLLPPVDTHHSGFKVCPSRSPTSEAGSLDEEKGRMAGEVTRSVGRFQVAQIQEQASGSVATTVCSDQSDLADDSALLEGNHSVSSPPPFPPPSSSLSAARDRLEVMLLIFCQCNSLLFSHSSFICPPPHLLIVIPLH